MGVGHATGKDCASVPQGKAHPRKFGALFALMVYEVFIGQKLSGKLSRIRQCSTVAGITQIQGTAKKS